MDFITPELEKKEVTVRELINKLIEQNPDDEVFAVDKDGIELHDITIKVRKTKYLGALFG